MLTENNNPIVDVKNLELSHPEISEEALNNIPGVVENGIFAKRKPDHVFVGEE